MGIFIFCFQLHFGQEDQGRVLDASNVPEIILQLKKQPTSLDQLKQLESLNFSIENYREALKYSLQLLELEETDAHRYKVARGYEKLGQYKNALSFYEQLWEKDSLNSVIGYRVCKLLVQIRDFKKARFYLQKLSERDPNHPTYPYQLGLIHVLHQKYSSAIDAFLEVYKRDSTHVESMYQLSNAFSQLKIEDSTLLFFNKGLRLAPDHKNLNRLKAKYLRKEQKYDSVIKILLRQDSLYPQEFFNAKMLGLCYFSLEQYDAAEKWFKAALEINPEDFKSYTYLGHIGLKRNNTKDALLNYLFGVRTARIRRDEEYLGLGYTYIEMNELATAIRMFEHAFEENGNNDDALFEWALTSDRYYADKKIGYKKYELYLRRFSYKKDTTKLNFIKSRMGALKEKLFLDGEIVE